MTQELASDSPAARTLLRPGLIVSRHTLREHTTFLRHLLVGLADESIATALICPPGYDIESVAPAPVTVLVHPLAELPLMQHVGIERLAAQLDKLKPTMLHNLCESRSGLTRRLAHRLSLPYIQTVNSVNRRFCRAAAASRHCAAIIVPAETIRRHVATVCPRFTGPIKQIDAGTFVDEHTVCFSDPSRLPAIVVAQPLRRPSDFEPFLRAIKGLLADGYELMVVLMGSGRAEHRLRRLLAELGISQTVTIVPILDPWRSVLAAGDVFVQPRPLKAFSTFLLEAMSLGTAVAACLGGVDDLIVPDQTAVVFEPDDEHSIRQALARLLDDHDLARRLAVTAQEHIRARHSVSAMLAAMLDAYGEAQARYGLAVPARTH